MSLMTQGLDDDTEIISGMTDLIEVALGGGTGFPLMVMILVSYLPGFLLEISWTENAPAMNEVACPGLSMMDASASETENILDDDREITSSLATGP